MTDKTSSLSTVYVRRLGAHHFAYLRAVVNGFDVQSAAKRYLGIEHGHAAVTAHRQVVDLVRGAARRRKASDWRLVGIVIEAAAPSDPTPQPSLEDWAAEQGLDGWSEAELLEMYEEAHPAAPSGQALRKQRRNERLRAKQLALLNQLQREEAQPAKPTDSIAGWFDELTAQRLKRTGLLMVGELQALVARGGRWWSTVPAIGEGKARRIEAYLKAITAETEQLARQPEVSPLGAALRQLDVQPLETTSVDARTALTFPALPSPAAQPSPPASAPSARLPGQRDVAGLDGSDGINRALRAVAKTAARNDREAIDAWIAARAKSDKTAVAYRREAERLLLWCIVERQKPLSSMVLEDCLAFMSFLSNIPTQWISRRNAVRHGEGWAPFAGQLSPSSRHQALSTVAALFHWLVRAGYLEANPWALVNLRAGDEAGKRLLDTRAFTPEAWQAIRDFVVAAPESPARSRTLFLLDFGEATGLRASELLGCKLGDFQRYRGGMALQVHGKGSKNRVIAVSKQAQRALAAYLEARGQRSLTTADPQLPLLTSVVDPQAGVTYSSLYRTTKTWFRNAIRASDLDGGEREEAMRGSLHWLRHTCGTRALERGTPLEVIQAQFGHADPRTTMRYANPQLERLMDGMDKAFGGEE